MSIINWIFFPLHRHSVPEWSVRIEEKTGKYSSGSENSEKRNGDVLAGALSVDAGEGGYRHRRNAVLDERQTPERTGLENNARVLHREEKPVDEDPSAGVAVMKSSIAT
ncbi:MAG: hypothetical protein WCR05_05870 [Sphaerochaetaceae bacterium]|jgi:hypothetical protein